MEHPRLQRRFYGIALAAAGRAHTAYVASAADARHAGHNDLRRYTGQPGRLCGGLLGTAHTGQRVAQQQRGLGHIGDDQIRLAAQTIHSGHHVGPQAAVQPPSVAQHRVHDLERAGPQLKRLLDELCLRGVRQIARVDAVKFHAQSMIMFQCRGAVAGVGQLSRGA